MSSQTILTMPFTQIIAFKGYLYNLGKPLNSTLTSESVSMIHIWKHHIYVMLFITHVGQDRLFYFYA